MNIGFAKWQAQVTKAIRSLRLVDSETIQWERGTNGIQAHARNVGEIARPPLSQPDTQESRVPTLRTSGGTYYVDCPFLRLSLFESPQNVTVYPQTGLYSRGAVSGAGLAPCTWSFSGGYPTRIGIRPGDYMANGVESQLRWIHNSANGLNAATTNDYVPASNFSTVSVWNVYISNLASSQFAPVPAALPSIRSYDPYFYMDGTQLRVMFAWDAGGRRYYNSSGGTVCGSFSVSGKSLSASTSYDLFYEIPKEWYTTINAPGNASSFLRSADELNSSYIYLEAGYVTTDANTNLIRVGGPWPFPPYMPLSQLSPSASYLKNLSGTTGSVTGDHGILKGAT